MIAIIYSGSRYASWRLAGEKNKDVVEFNTAGINPFFNDEKYITQLLNKNSKLINYAEKIKKIYFYGAGASSKERKEIVKKALGGFFKYSKVNVAHDIDAAAKATCDDKPGIVCIIGSGSNCAFFNGKNIIENNFGLGYSIADEGSANWLGKTLLKDFLNETLPINLKNALLKKYDLDRKIILDKIYKQAHSTNFLTSFTEFFIENREDPYIIETIKLGFNNFIETYLLPVSMQYGGKHPIYFVGSVAANFQDHLRSVAKENKLTINTVIKEPIYNLLNYYANKN
jgi:N-acetylglucosamine kinase-like BadF-type ATPase